MQNAEEDRARKAAAKKTKDKKLNTKTSITCSDDTPLYVTCGKCGQDYTENEAHTRSLPLLHCCYRTIQATFLILLTVKIFDPFLTFVMC